MACCGELTAEWIAARLFKNVTRKKQKALEFEGFPFLLLKPDLAYAPKFFAAKSQFTMFQNASTNFGRALR